MVRRLAGLAALAILSWAGTAALAQTITYNGQSVDVSTLPAEVQAQDSVGRDPTARRARSFPAGAMPAGGGATVAAEEPKKDGDKKDEKKEDGKTDEGGTVKRGEGNGEADPNELKAKLDKDGKVQFSFRNQPWTDVLQWYAEISKSSLDWQELPADKLNLITQRRHTLPETRDLLNRYLLARGFTMLAQGDVLTVVKIEKIDPSLVPQRRAGRSRGPPAVRLRPRAVRPARRHGPGQGRRGCEGAAHAHGQGDAAVGEQADHGHRRGRQLARRARPVVLAKAGRVRRHPPEAVSDSLSPGRLHRRPDHDRAGAGPSSRKAPMELQVEQQRMQLFMQMQQQGKDISKMLKQDGPPVFIAVDQAAQHRRRSTPRRRKWTIVQRVVDQFDVPGAGAAQRRASDDS